MDKKWTKCKKYNHRISRWLFSWFSKYWNTERNKFLKTWVPYMNGKVWHHSWLCEKILSLKLKNHTVLMNHFIIFNDLITELLDCGAKIEEIDSVPPVIYIASSLWRRYNRDIDIVGGQLNIGLCKNSITWPWDKINNWWPWHEQKSITSSGNKF